jgi:hypothetical protein
MKLIGSITPSILKLRIVHHRAHRVRLHLLRTIGHE